MGFEKLSRSRTSAKTGVHAFLRVSKNNNGGNIRITSEGLELLRTNGHNYSPDMQIDIYVDKDTGKIALKQSDYGEFKMTKNAKKATSLRVTSADLARQIGKNTDYSMSFDEDNFDAILIPLKNQEETKNFDF
jgi:hypothetical protein